MKDKKRDNMIEKIVSCPACGSTDLKREVKTQSALLTLGPRFQFDEVIYECNMCKEKGDFTAETDANFTLAEKSAQESAVRNMIDSLKGHMTLVNFERVFELPIRTSTRWKSGDFSAASMALLRTVTTYPWITEVAEHKFDPMFARQVIIREAAKALGEALSKQGPNIDIVLENDPNAYIAHIQIAKTSSSTDQLINSRSNNELVGT